MMRKVLTALLGLLLGVAAGLTVSVPIIAVLDAMDITTSPEDLPLHGVIPFIVTVYGCGLVGGVVGAVWAWGRSGRGPRIPGRPDLDHYRGMERPRRDRHRRSLRVSAGQGVSERGFEPLRAAKLTRPST